MAIQVARIGVICVTNGEDTLKAHFGSCVGIALFWKKQRLYGLSHCLVAERPAGALVPSAKYISDAIPMMLEAMGNTGRQRFELQAVVVGGGTMLQEFGNADAKKIGPNNLMAAKKYLAQFNVHLHHLEDAGRYASQIVIDGKTGDYKLNLIPKLASEI